MQTKGNHTELLRRIHREIQTKGICLDNEIVNEIEEAINGTSLFPELEKKSDFTGFRDVWFDFFQKTDRPRPGFDGAQGKALKGIITKLKASSKEGVDPLDSFGFILDNWSVQDEWMQENALDLKIFNQKFNVIINKLRNGKRKGFTSYVAEILADNPDYKNL